MLLEGQIDEGMFRMKVSLKLNDRHFIMEETLLFPTLDYTTHMLQGSTHLVRMEHQQMRGVMTAIEDAIIHVEKEPILEKGKILLILMQQHNMKEEGNLYPMANQHQPPRWMNCWDGWKLYRHPNEAWDWSFGEEMDHPRLQRDGTSGTLLRVLESLETIKKEEGLRMLHRVKPLLLFPRLEERVFEYQVFELTEDLIEFLIWHGKT